MQEDWEMGGWGLMGGVDGELCGELEVAQRPRCGAAEGANT
jgi:hypothetical protein